MPVTIDGSNTPTAGGVGYGDGTELAFTSAGSAGQVLLSNGASAPSFGAVPTVNLATGVTGTLPVANGGTGAASLTANNVLLGNGTSAVQVVAPGTAGNVLRSNGTTWTSAAVPSGALTLLQTITVSGSPSTVELETGIGSTYDFYLITYTAVKPTTNNRILYLRMKLDGSYNTSSNYVSQATGGYNYGSGNLATNQSGVTEIQLTLTSISSASTDSAHGEVWFSNPTSTSQYKIINFAGGILNGSGLATLQGSGSNLASTTGSRALTGIQFFFVTETFASGTFRLYGFANS